MKFKHLFTAFMSALAMATTASAQFPLDLQDLFGRLDLQQQPRTQEKAVTVDYNVDFHYFLDVRAFGASDDIFIESETINIARVSPSAIIRFNQGNVATHRLALGIDLAKDMGANPTKAEIYSEREHDTSISNTGLMKDIFFYYNYMRKTGRGQLGFYAGIHPRTVLQGSYSRAIFADEVIYTDPNIEGITFQYSSPHIKLELVGDLAGKKGVDRIGAQMAFTSFEYMPFKWVGIGLDGIYTHVDGNYLYAANVEFALANPYLKFDFAPLLGMQEFYVKGGGIGSYHNDHRLSAKDKETGEVLVERPRFPLGAEATVGIRHWGIGLEDTFYYGENQQVYYGSAYKSTTYASKYADTLYQGEEFYFTRRSVPTWYNRAEVYWQPLDTGFLTARVSAVGHFITPAGSDPAPRVGPYVGLQAKATLLFNLDAFRHPRESAPAVRRTREKRTQRSADGPLFSL